MRKQDHLMYLIASLEPNEKRYFRLFSGLQPGEKRYLKLFEALESKEKYEVKELCAELDVKPEQLAVDKHYLTQILLQSLRNYDHESTELAVLRNNKENIQALINRRIFDFALDMIEKNLAQAWLLEAFEIIADLLVMRSVCSQNLNKYTDGSNELVEHKLCAQKLKQVVELIHLRGKARYLEVLGGDEKRFKSVLNDPLIKGGANRLQSLRAKSLRYEILSHFYSSVIDDTRLLALAREERKLYLKHPVIKSINPVVYFSNFSRLIAGESDYELRLELAASMLKELHDPEIKISKRRRDSLTWSLTLANLWNLRYLGRFAEALPVAEKIYAQSSDRSEYERLSVGFEYALILLHNRLAPQAAEVIDELLRYKSDVRINMQPFIRLLHIMSQLDMRNYAVLPAVIKATKFWLKGKEDSNNEMDLFLKHAGKIARAPVNKRPEWQDLLNDIETGNMPVITNQLQLDLWVKAILKDRNI